MQIKHFNNVFDDQLQIFWKGNEYYLSANISNKDKSDLRNIMCTRYYFEGAREIRENYEKIFQECHEKLFELLFLNSERSSFGVFLEDSIKLPNRIRTYKGLISKMGLDTKSYIEIEKSIDNKTLIAGIVMITQENYRFIVNSLHDSRTAFILSSNHKYLFTEVLEEIIERYRDDQTYTSLNYAEIIANFCSKGDMLLKFSGDGGDNYLAIDTFYDKNFV